MEGSMLWFNVEKGYGYIQTDEDERLYVDSSGFAPGARRASATRSSKSCGGATGLERL